MEHQGQNQVFQAATPARRIAYQWTGRSLLFLAIILSASVVVTYYRIGKPRLPELRVFASAPDSLPQQELPSSMTKQEKRKYHGFADFLEARAHNRDLRTDPRKLASKTRAAFYVDWDPQSFYSLQRAAGSLDMVFPEWFFIDPKTDTLMPMIDEPALDLMKKHHIAIVPLINNINDSKGGGFDPAMIHRILHSEEKRKRLIADLLRYVERYGLQGINIDFEEFHERSDEPMVSFQQQVYRAFHAKGLLVTQDVMVSNTDFNLPELAKYNDRLVLMAYDEHWSTSIPGPVCSQKWIEKVVDEAAAKVGEEKLMLGIAGYGYDWPKNKEATTLSYQQALAKAKLGKAQVDFDDDSYNLRYRYQDDRGGQHDVYFTDAATNFNTIRFADEYGLAGTALWRLGSEDDRLWEFYRRDLSNRSASAFDPSALTTLRNLAGKPDYIGDGEVLDVVTPPEKGNIRITMDTTEHVISEEEYISLPTRYVIRKFGNVDKQVLLSFDDGPDPVYTARILDILRKEKVPAAFFVVGSAAQSNLPLLKRISREGHEIGNHTFTHPNMAEVSEERAISEMETTRLLIEAATGRSTILFRAPYNADAEPSTEVELRPVALSRAEDYYTVGESIDPNDWEAGITADSIYARVVRQYEANPSKGIILLHDAGGDRQATVEALPRIIHYFKVKGIGFTTVSRLLGLSKDAVMPLVKSRLLSIDSGVADLLYWLGQFLSSAFWIAIVLGMLRIISMGWMAILQRRREERKTAISQGEYPQVSIIVPAYNEEVNAVKTVRNLLQQDYPRFDIVFVDDGSRDGTFQKVEQAFRDDPRVFVVTKPNGGKSSALNEGIRLSNADYLVCIDADTQLKGDALTKLMNRMLADGNTGAVAGNVKAGNKGTLLAKWQNLEYITSQNFDRRAFDLVNGITVVPGAIGAFRRKAMEEAGGFTTDTLAEDCDLTIRIIRAGYEVVNCTEAIAVTEVPETLGQFMKQRSRWTYGVMQCFWKHRDACFDPSFKGLGIVSLPNILIFQILMPMLAPLADLMLLFSLFWNRTDPAAQERTWVFYLVFLLVDMLVGFVALSFEKESRWNLLWLVPQRFIYRQLMYVILFRSVSRVFKGEAQGWGSLQRTGHVQELVVPLAPDR